MPLGDQANDTEARIRMMISSYIKRKTCIILAVSPANADLANSDALRLARIADPDGELVSCSPSFASYFVARILNTG